MSTIKANQWLNPDGTENYKCRAWCVSNASSGSPVITSAGNVSSITDNGTGDFTVNFATALPDADYAIVGTGSATNAATNPATAFVHAATVASAPTLKTASAVRVLYSGGTGAGIDGYTQSFIAFR